MCYTRLIKRVIDQNEVLVRLYGRLGRVTKTKTAHPNPKVEQPRQSKQNRQQVDNMEGKAEQGEQGEQGKRGKRGVRMERVRLSKNAVLRREYRAQTPAWRRAIVGYVLSVPIVATLTASMLMLQRSLTHVYFPGSALLLSVLFTALIWGVGPALFALLLSMVALDYFFVPPGRQLDVHTLHGLLQLVPYMVSGLAIAFITVQREYARLQALAAEYDAQVAAQELEESNQKLQDASNLKDRFLSIASHELKTPITTIRGQAQLVLRRLSRQKELPPDMQDIRKTLDKINEQTMRLTSLIDELMDVSSIRAGKMQLHRQQCDLVALCRDVIEDQHVLSGRTIDLETSCEQISLYADRERLAQVLINLVSNALKYSPPESAVEVHVNRQEACVRLEVIDHGKGVPKDQREHIFETFYRTNDAQSSTKGLGLGLAITKDIVERHNGRIWCESTPGQGSTFVVELPWE